MGLSCKDMALEPRLPPFLPQFPHLHAQSSGTWAEVESWPRFCCAVPSQRLCLPVLVSCLWKGGKEAPHPSHAGENEKKRCGHHGKQSGTSSEG